MPILHQHDSDSDAVKIAHEKEKTKRFTLYIGSLVLVAVFGIYFVFRASDNGGTRKFDLDLKGGKIALSVDKPIVAQIGVTTKSFETPKGIAEYTTGKVDQSDIRKIESAQGTFSNTSFVGQNFVNSQAGFLFTIDHPQNWQVVGNGSLGNAEVINNFVSTDGNGNNLNVVIEQLPRQAGISEYVSASIQQMAGAGMITEEPRVSYDIPSNTAFIYFQNLITGGPSIQKYVINGMKAYIATANYSPSGGDAQTMNDMLNMISSFTLIGS